MDSGGCDRSVAGILTEALGSATVESAGKPPRWVVLGVGTFFAHKSSRGATITSNCVKPRSRISVRAGTPGQITHWAKPTRSRRIESTRFGFALVEAMMSEMRQGFPAFVQGMVQEGNKLDEAFSRCTEAPAKSFWTELANGSRLHYGNLE